ncbi:MAG: MBL fold metallo-hydrolase [Elusimicrobiota bacterium]
MRRVTDGLYILSEGGPANVYLIEGSADLTLIDSGASRAAPRLLAEIKANGFSPKDIGRIVLTHAHADHVGGVEAFRELQAVKVYAHPKEIPVLCGEKRVPMFQGFKGFFLNFSYERSMPWGPLDFVQPIEPGTPIRAIPQWQILHTPGHTEGSISLFHPVRQILICGDVLFSRDKTLHLPDASYLRDEGPLQKSLKGLSKLDCDVLCCGHGPVIRGGAFRYIEAVAARKRSR